MSGRNPPSYCTLTLIAMQGHQQKGRQTNTSSNNKDKSNTIIETSTAEDHDDENLHNMFFCTVCCAIAATRICSESCVRVWSSSGADIRRGGLRRGLKLDKNALVTLVATTK